MTTAVPKLKNISRAYAFLAGGVAVVELTIWIFDLLRHLIVQITLDARPEM